MNEDELIPAKKYLKAFATRVSGETDIQVELADQTDASYSWQGAFIHPLQPLENAHQRDAREAVWMEKDPEKHRDVSGEALGRYFGFTASSPQLMPTANETPEVTGDIFEDKLKNARGIVSTAASVVRAYAQEGAPAPEAQTITELQRKLKECIAPLQEILQEFEGIRQNYDVEKGDLPILGEVETNLTKAGETLDGEALPAASIGACIKQYLKPALQMLESMLTGLACVQTFHVIEPFYLYRLLVKYQIKANQKIEEDQKRHVSGNLTDILNNEQTWVRDWLQAKMVTLDEAMAKNDRDVGFHLKGGRALYLALHQPEEGKNDWDTSVLINPELSSRKWYEKLAKVHNDILRQLNRYKREFFVLAHKRENIEQMKTSMVAEKDKVVPDSEADPEQANLIEGAEQVEHLADASVAGTAELDPDDFGATTLPMPGCPLFFSEESKTKAEMIDIGIARRATPELIGQWHHVIKSAPGLLNKSWTQNIPIPAHRYYLDEYLEMIREAYDEPKTKVEKRVKRLAEILNIAPEQDTDKDFNMEKTIQLAHDRVDEGQLAPCLDEIKGLKEQEKLAEWRLLTVLVEEYYTAYDFSWKTGLASAFVDEFKKNLEDTSYFRTSKPIDDCEKKLDTPKKQLLKRISFAHKLGENLNEHRRNRANYFGFFADGYGPKEKEAKQKAKERRVLLGNFVKSLYTASVVTSKKPSPKKRPFLSSIFSAKAKPADTGIQIFSPDSELQFQFAVTGAFAAHLHADYAANFSNKNGTCHVPKKLRTRLAEKLDPVDALEIKIYCDPTLNMKNAADWVYEQVLKPAMDTYVQSDLTPNLEPLWIEESKDEEGHIDKEAELLVFWPESIKADQFAEGKGYRPVIARIRVVTNSWPQLSFIWGYPVLSLPNLIQEYDQRAQEMVEYSAKHQLTKTSNLLRALATYFDESKLDAPEDDAEAPPNEDNQPPPPPNEDNPPPPPPEDRYTQQKQAAKTMWLNEIAPAFRRAFTNPDLPEELAIDDRDLFDGDGGPGSVRVYKKVVTEPNASVLLYALAHETGHAVTAQKIMSMQGRAQADVPQPANDGAKQHEYLADLIAIHVIQTQLNGHRQSIFDAMDAIANKLGDADAMHPSGAQRVAKMRRLLNGDNTLDELINDVLNHPPHGNL